MALLPHSHGMEDQRGVWGRLRKFLGLQPVYRFAPNQVLTEFPNIDPLLIPRVPMTSDRIDPALMLQSRAMGFTHAQEITEQTHPELYVGWGELCRRAGFPKPLQLIVTSGQDPNAINVSENEVIVSTSLLRMLNARELLAILGHELGHAKHDAPHSENSVYTELGMTGVSAWIGNQLGGAFAERFYGYRLPTPGATVDPANLVRNPRTGEIVAELAAPHWSVRGLLSMVQVGAMIAMGWAGWLLSKQITVRPAELRADREGAKLSGDPQGLIHAFEKLSQLTAHQSTWRHFWQYAYSGYPSFDARIAQLKEMVAQMPPGETPVYKMVELLAGTPEQRPPIDVFRAHPQGKPGPQVHGISDIERVVFIPEKTQMH